MNKYNFLNAARLVSARMISDVGNWVSRIAVLTLALEINGAASSVSFVSIASLIPYILFSPLAGKVVDRYNQKWILICGDFLRSVLVIFIPVFKTNMLVILFLISLVSTFTDVCNDSIVPFIVENRQLKHVNSINSTFSSLIMVLGPSLSGILTALFPVQICFYLDSASYLVSGLLLLGIHYEHHPHNLSESSVAKKETFLETLRYIKSSPKLFSIIITIAAIGLAAGMLNSLLIVYVYRYMNQTSAGYGLLLSSKGAAMLVTSILLYKIVENVSCEKIFNISLLGLGFSLLVFPLNSSFAIGLVIQAVNGICNAGYAVSRVSLIQLSSDPNQLGKVFSVNSLLSNAFSITSLGIFGVLADYIGVRTVLLIGGGIVVLASIYSVVAFRKSDSIRDSKEIN